MQITGAEFHPPWEDTEPAFVLRVAVTASDIEFRSAPVIARVGPVPVELIVPFPDGTGFSGLLRAVPPAGSTLEVGYADTGVAPTGFSFDPPIA